MQRDEEREDERKDEPHAAEPEPLPLPEEIVNVSPAGGEGETPASAQVADGAIDQPATAEPSTSSPAADVAGMDLTAGASEPGADLSTEGTMAQVDTPAEPPASVTRIELPADMPISTTPGPARRIPRHLDLPLPHGGEPPEDPVDRIFPPALRMPLDPHDPGAGSKKSEPAESPAPAERAGIGQPLPRIQVLVTLADARAHLEEVLDVAAERMAPEFEELAEEKVRHAFWAKKCEDRAADWRLRGP